MITHYLRGASRRLFAVSALFLAALQLVTSTLVVAAPGAHGPNGEHLDGAAATRAATSLPRVEAKSEAFELVATLSASELSILIDRFDTNEPVLEAALEVESGGVKAKATFHADQGNYAIDDPKLLALLRSVGEHALVFTLVAGTDSDLLDATLLSSAAGTAVVGTPGDHGHARGDDDHGNGHGHALVRAGWIGAGLAGLALIGGIVWWRRRRHNAEHTQGALQ